MKKLLLILLIFFLNCSLIKNDNKELRNLVNLILLRVATLEGSTNKTVYIGGDEEEREIDKNTCIQNKIENQVLKIGTCSTKIEAWYYAGSGLKSISFSEKNPVKSILERAFSYNSLEKVSFPDNIIGIGASAFSDNNLKSIVLGKSVKNIANRAFANNKLTALSLDNSTALSVIGEYAFENNKIAEGCLRKIRGNYGIKCF